MKAEGAARRGPVLARRLRKVQPNLLKHAPGFPSAAALSAVVTESDRIRQGGRRRRKATTVRGWSCRREGRSRPLWSSHGGQQRAGPGVEPRPPRLRRSRTSGGATARVCHFGSGRCRPMAPPRVPTAAMGRHPSTQNGDDTTSRRGPAQRRSVHATGPVRTSRPSAMISERQHPKRAPLALTATRCILEGDADLLGLIDSASQRDSPAFGGWGGPHLAPAPGESHSDAGATRSPATTVPRHRRGIDGREHTTDRRRSGDGERPSGDQPPLAGR
jgi:hypothetical protein